MADIVSVTTAPLFTLGQCNGPLVCLEYRPRFLQDLSYQCWFMVLFTTVQSGDIYTKATVCRNQEKPKAGITFVFKVPCTGWAYAHSLHKNNSIFAYGFNLPSAQYIVPLHLTCYVNYFAHYICCATLFDAQMKTDLFYKIKQKYVRL